MSSVFVTNFVTHHLQVSGRFCQTVIKTNDEVLMIYQNSKEIGYLAFKYIHAPKKQNWQSTC